VLLGIVRVGEEEDPVGVLARGTLFSGMLQFPEIKKEGCLAGQRATIAWSHWGEDAGNPRAPGQELPYQLKRALATRRNHDCSTEIYCL